MITLKTPVNINALENIDEVVKKITAKLAVSYDFKSLLRVMLAKNETERPNMDLIRKAAGQLVANERISLFLEDKKRRMSLLPVVHDELVCVERTAVKVFDFKAKQWDTIAVEGEGLQVDEGSRYVCVEEQVFCSGGRTYLGTGTGRGCSTAYFLRFDGSFTPLQAMTFPRFHHGLFHSSVHKSIFTFGGSSKAYTRREKHSASLRYCLPQEVSPTQS